jgi:hypothetical protein
MLTDVREKAGDRNIRLLIADMYRQADESNLDWASKLPVG